MAEIKLKKRYKYAGDIFQKLIGIRFNVEAATDFLNEVEDANVVEVVRCKDCKWVNEIGCAISIVDESDKPTENDYCSFAERRSNK